MAVDGWDPVHRCERQKAPADIVNLGFVLNVIEDPLERDATLVEAFELARDVLSVSAQIVVPLRSKHQVPFNDGVLTRIGTFQKYYTQAELREYIERILKTEALPAAPGVFYAFKVEELKQHYLSTCYRRRASVPRRRISETLYEQHKELLEPFIQRVVELARIPEADEYRESDAIIEALGSLRRAFNLVQRVTGIGEWDQVRRRKREDLLVYLALACFRKRAMLSQLPIELQRDIKSFFGTYKAACSEADALLFAAGDEEQVNDACKESSVGKLLPKALYVHRTALDSLSPLLRIYEGCARAWIGELDGANIIKLHRHSGRVSYLSYPDFDRKPHPILHRTVKLSLRTLDLNCYDYTKSVNPPILHRKETFVSSDYNGYAKFARLTRQEERAGLLEETSTIGTRDGWQYRLEQFGYELKGHRLLKSKPKEGSSRI